MYKWNCGLNELLICAANAVKMMWSFDLYATDLLKRKIGHHYHHTTNMMRHNRRRSKYQNPSSSSRHWLWHYMPIMIYFLSISQIDAQTLMNSTIRQYTIPPAHSYRGSRYTIDELINGKFTFKVSDDIDMDPCKASTYICSHFFYCFDHTCTKQKPKMRRKCRREKIHNSFRFSDYSSLCTLNCLHQITE